MRKSLIVKGLRLSKRRKSLIVNDLRNKINLAIPPEFPYLVYMKMTMDEFLKYCVAKGIRSMSDCYIELEESGIIIVED